MLVIAHRGASVDAPENTLEAFRLAVEQRADMIETDLHLSRDKQIPLYHDSRVDGIDVGDLTLAELRARRPGVPTLQEALDAVGELIPFNLEIKRRGDNRTDYDGLEAAVLPLLRARGLLEKTLFSSFFDSTLERLRALEPAARIGLLISRRSTAAMQERAARLGAEAVHPEHFLTTSELVTDLHARGHRVHVFTVDRARDQRRLDSWGVDGIFTNVPARLRLALAES